MSGTGRPPQRAARLGDGQWLGTSLAAVESAAALQLYEKRGYERVAQVGRVGEQCFLMAKELTSPTPVSAPEGDGCP